MGYEAEMRQGDLAARLNAIGQGHVFRFWAELTPDEQETFSGQLEGLDWDLIARLAATMAASAKPFVLGGNVQPAPYYANKPADPAKREKLRAARARGEELLRAGRVAAFVVAGGQGTRLGWDGPKGTFPATAIRRKPLFQCFAEYLLAVGRRYGKPVPLYIMTSPHNDAATRDFWKDHAHFGMNSVDVMQFPQEQMPALDYAGRVLLERKDSLALSPNGHGGSLMALWKSGAIADMKKRAITQISYFQVDNPIVRCVDPVFLGLHDLDGAEMSSKMLPKAYPKEKLGNFCLIDGKMTVIEYSDLPDELAEQRLGEQGGKPDGELRFRAGSIALHAIRRDFVESLNAGGGGGEGRGGEGFALPFHRAEKKIPCIDLETGREIKPEKNNGIKLETFVFDALPLTHKSIVYETDRQDEFAPIKNAQGIDSPQTSMQTTTARNAQWLENAGIDVPRKSDGMPDCVIEIAASFALYPEDIAAKKGAVPKIGRGDRIYLE